MRRITKNVWKTIKWTKVMTFLLWLWLLLLLFATPINPLSISCHCENKFSTRINLWTHIDIISCENYMNYPVVRTTTWFSGIFINSTQIQISRKSNLYIVFVWNIWKSLENHLYMIRIYAYYRVIQVIFTRKKFMCTHKRCNGTQAIKFTTN